MQNVNPWQVDLDSDIDLGYNPNQTIDLDSDTDLGYNPNYAAEEDSDGDNEILQFARRQERGLARYINYYRGPNNSEHQVLASRDNQFEEGNEHAMLKIAATEAMQKIRAMHRRHGFDQYFFHIMFGFADGSWRTVSWPGALTMASWRTTTVRDPATGRVDPRRSTYNWAAITNEIHEALLTFWARIQSKYIEDLAGGLVNFVVGVHAPPPRRGACSQQNQFNKKVTFEDHEGKTLTVHVDNFKVKNNNCGLKCLFQFYKRYCIKDSILCQPPLPTMFDRRTKKLKPMTIMALKKQMGLEKTAMLGQEHFEIISRRLFFHVVCRDKMWNLMWEVNTKCKRRVTLMWDDNHYMLAVKDPLFLRQKRKCTLSCDRCGKARVLQTHRCMGPKRRRIITKLVKSTEEKEIADFMIRLSTLKGHWFVHGAGGTGKSFLIEKIRELFESSDTRFRVLTPTGVAAVGIHGTTCASFFRLGVMRQSPDKILQNLMYQAKENYAEIEAMETIIFDEISMISPKVFFMMSELCKRIRKNVEPFGGIQIIMIGDFMQLPPVAKGSERMSFVFETELFQELQQVGLRVLNLRTGYRFKGDPKWFELLMRIRLNKITVEDVFDLKSREKSELQIEKEVQRRDLKPTRIYGKRKRVNTINEKQITAIYGEEREFFPCYRGGKELPPKKLRAFNKEIGREGVKPLTLKVGSEVMCVANVDVEGGIVNGTRGVVTGYAIDELNMVWVPMVDYEGVDGITTQKHCRFPGTWTYYVPLIIAHAITSHKAQSKTLTCVITDLSFKDQIFEASQLYVILSRVTTMKNLFIHKGTFDINSIFVNPRAHHFTTWADEWKEGCRPWSLSNPQNYLDNIFFPEIRNMRDVETSVLKFRLKSPAKKSILKNIIFYDYETCWHPNDVMEKPYFNHLIYYLHGKVEIDVSQCVICEEDQDILTRSFDLIMKILLDHCARHKEWKANERYNTSGNEGPLYLCAYNGGSFDFQFIMQKLLKSEHCKRFIPHITMKGTKIVIMTFYDKQEDRCCLIAHDMINILPHTSLSKACKSFLGDDKMKDVFPHNWCTPKRLYEELTPATIVDMPLDGFPTKMRDTVIKSGINLKQYHFHKELHKYGRMDVIALHRLYEKIEDLCQEIVGTSILRFSTLSKLTWYGFLKNIPFKDLQRSPRYAKETRYTQIHRMSRTDDNKVNQAVTGGKVYPRFKSWTSKDYKEPYECIEDYYVDLDVKSMYVSVMMKEKFPMGLHEHYEEGSDRVRTLQDLCKQGHHRIHPDTTPFFIAKVICKPHAKEMEPCIGRKEYDAKGKSTSKLIWDNKERLGWYTNIDLWLLLKNEGTISEVKEVYQWPLKGFVFSEWVKETYHGKEESGTAAERSFYKTLGNACYGSSLQRVFDDIIKHVVTPDDLTDFHYKYNFHETVNFEEVCRNTHKMLILKGTNKVNADFEFTQRPRYMGAFVLSYTRKMYDEFYSVINPYRREGSLRALLHQILYGDTDSMFAPASSIPRLLDKGMIGNDAGQLTDDISDDWFQKDEEHRFAKIIDYEGPAPKSYGIRAVHHPSIREKILKEGKHIGGFRYEWKGRSFEVNDIPQVIEDITKFKGISKKDFTYEFRGVTHNSLTLPMIRAILKEREKGEKITVTMPGRLRRNGISRTIAEKARGKQIYNIERKDLKRSLFVTRYGGRQAFKLAPYVTVPCHFDTLSYNDIALALFRS